MVVNKLKEILESKNLSFSDLKNLLGERKIKVNNSQLSLYANGKRNPKNKKMWIEIAQVLEVELQEIIVDINYYLSITKEISENGAEKKSETENGLRNNSLSQELFLLIDKKSASEVEKVNRYCGLATTFEKLGKEIEREGAVIYVPAGDSMVKKTNPAISEQVKINAALIKLDEWFDLKRQSQKDNPSSKNSNWSAFT